MLISKFIKRNFSKNTMRFREEKERRFQATRDTLQWAGVIFSLSALAFQISVLYPWHPEVEEEIEHLMEKVRVNEQKIVDNTKRLEKLKVLNKKLSKINKNRNHVIQEIIKTETEYVEKLSLMLEIYKPQLKKKNLISDKEIDSIFGNVGLIYNINKSLLENLKLLKTEKSLENKNRRTSKISALKKLKYSSTVNLHKEVIVEYMEKDEIALQKRDEDDEVFVHIASPDTSDSEEELEEEKKESFKLTPEIKIETMPSLETRKKVRQSFTDIFQTSKNEEIGEKFQHKKIDQIAKESRRRSSLISQNRSPKRNSGTGLIEKFFTPRSPRLKSPKIKELEKRRKSDGVDTVEPKRVNTGSLSERIRDEEDELETHQSISLMKNSDLSLSFKKIEVKPVLNEEKSNIVFAPRQQAVKGILKSTKGKITIGEIFRKFAPFLKVYAFYFTNFEDAQSLLNSLIEKNSTFSTSLKQIKKKEGRENLSNLIIQPIQRIPRYQLILHELLKYTPEFHFDYSDIKKSEILMIEVNQLLDKFSKGREMNSIIETINEKFINFDQNIIQPHRQLIGYEKKIYFQQIDEQISEEKQFELYLFSDVLILFTSSNEKEEIRIFHLVFLETNITNSNEFQFEFLFKKMKIKFENEEKSINILNELNHLKQKEIDKLISGLDKKVKLNEILISKKNITKELKNKIPNFERLYEFYEKGKEELLNIEEEIFDYYKYGSIGKNTIKQNEEEKLKLTLKLEECEKRLNLGSTIIYRLNSKRREIDYLLLHFLRNDSKSFQRYFGKSKEVIQESKLLEFIESREIYKLEDPVVVLKNLDENLFTNRNKNVDDIENLKTKQEEIFDQIESLKNNELLKDSKINEILNELKREFKNLNLKNNMQHITIKTLELDLKSTQEENQSFSTQITTLTQQNQRKKDLLDYMTKERRKSQKALEELEKNELSNLKRELIFQQEEIEKLKLENEKLSNMILSETNLNQERRDYLMNFKL
eukprot:gene5883-9711_t